MSLTDKQLRPTRRSKEAFAYFSQCQDTSRLPKIEMEADGHSAEVCFHVRESYGKDLPCKEPELLSRALNGKEWHGLTVTMVAEDYVGRIVFASDLKKYPDWIRKDILGRAKQIAVKIVGFVPKFVETGEDFTTICEDWRKA